MQKSWNFYSFYTMDYLSAPGDLFPLLSGLMFSLLKTNRPTIVASSSDSCFLFVRQLSDEKKTTMGRLIFSGRGCSLWQGGGLKSGSLSETAKTIRELPKQ